MTASSRHRYLPRQHGVALLMALVFLVVLTLMGVGVFSSTTAEEKIARNFRDREIALNAAQSAINAAEIVIQGDFDKNTAPTASARPPQAVGTDDCSGAKLVAGLDCPPVAPADLASIDLFKNNSGATELDGNYPTLIPAIPGLSEKPRYKIFFVANGSACGLSSSNTNQSCFLILGQSRGRLATTRVNLIEYFVN